MISPNRPTSTFLSRLSKKQETLVFFAMAAFAFLVLWQFGIDRMPLGADKSMQIYIAQEMARGHPPYATVIFPKTPLTGFLNALAILAGDRLGLRDVISVRLLSLLLGSLGVGFTFLMARAISQDLWVRAAAALSLLGFSIWGEAAATGAQPKLFMILWGLITLWALLEKRWFTSGLAASLSFLTYQPGAVYLVLSLGFPFIQTQSRRPAFLRALAGSLLPFFLVTLYLAAENALLPALRQTLGAQFAYLAAGKPFTGGEWTLQKGISRLLWIVGEGLSTESILVLMGIIGWLGFTSKTILSLRRPGAGSIAGANRWPVLLSGYWWLLFSLRELDGFPDLIPFLPHLAWGVGWLLDQAVFLSKSLVSSKSSLQKGTILSQLVSIVAILLILVYGLKDLPSPEEEAKAGTLQEQIVQATELEALLGPEGRVQAIGDPSLLVLMERSNLTPLIHLGPKHYNLLVNEPGGLEQILATIIAAKPEVIIIHPSNWQYPWTQPFLDFAKSAGVLRPAYNPPPVLVRGEVGAIPYPYPVNFGHHIQLLGYGLDNSQAYPGGRVEITLYLMATAEITETYTMALHFLSPDQVSYGQRNIFPLGNPYPTSLWEPGLVILDTYHISISPDFPAPAYGQIKLAFYLYPPWKGGSLPVLGVSGEELGEGVIFGRFRVASPSPSLVQNPVSFTLGDFFRLIGYHIPPSASPGQNLKVTLYWESLKPTSKDYQVFVHLIDAQGNLIAQGDAPPRNGFYPTSLWIPREIIKDPHRIPLPPALPPGEYFLRVGMYRLDTLERLPVTQEDGLRVANDEIVLEGVLVGSK